MMYFIAGFLTALLLVVLEMLLVLLRKPLLVESIEKLTRSVIKPQGSLISPEKTTLEQVQDEFKPSNKYDYDETV